MNTFRLVVVVIAGATIVLFTQFPFAATMQTRADHAAALARVSEAYQDARTRCGPLAGPAKDMCVVEAKAAEKRATAQAEANYTGTITSKTEGQIANADADFMIARVACDSMTGPEKVVCVKQARATNVKLIANVRAGT